MAQCSEWVTKPAWMTKIPIPKSRKSVQKRFKGKSRSIEAKFAFLRRHFFADFLSRLVADSQNRDGDDGDVDLEDGDRGGNEVDDDEDSEEWGIIISIIQLSSSKIPQW